MQTHTETTGPAEPDWDDLMTELRDEWARGCWRRLERLAGTLVALETDPADAQALIDLTREFHGFAGSGTSFGAPEVTAAGQAGEERAGELRDAGRCPRPEDLAAWRALCGRVAYALAGPA